MKKIKDQVEAEPAGAYTGESSTSNAQPLTTTAAEGAPIEEVQAGLVPPEAHASSSDRPESAHYAEGGSLAKALKEEEEEKKKKQIEVPEPVTPTS